MPESDTAPKLDDETTAALTLFNEYVEADRERTQREKRVKKAERAKDEAAAALKKLGDRSSAEEKAAAEQTYRDAADRWKKLRDGEEPDEAPAKAEAAAPAETEAAAPVEEAAAPAETEAAAPVEEAAAPTAEPEAAAPVEEAAAPTEEPESAEAEAEAAAPAAETEAAAETDEEE